MTNPGPTPAQPARLEPGYWLSAEEHGPHDLVRPTCAGSPTGH